MNPGAFSTWQRNAPKQTRPDWTGKGLVNATQVLFHGVASRFPNWRNLQSLFVFSLAKFSYWLVV